jgi:hypothetical protein
MAFWEMGKDGIMPITFIKVLPFCSSVLYQIMLFGVIAVTFFILFLYSSLSATGFTLFQ